MGKSAYKIWILLSISITLFSCESHVSYKGTILNNELHPIEGVIIKVQVNGEIREDYGIEVPDSIHYLKRDSINLAKGFKKKEHLLNEKGQYLEFKPYKTDSTGNFKLSLFEGSVFGQPKYKLLFYKEGYKEYEYLGDWKSEENLKIIMKHE